MTVSGISNILNGGNFQKNDALDYIRSTKKISQDPRYDATNLLVTPAPINMDFKDSSGKIWSVEIQGKNGIKINQDQLKLIIYIINNNIIPEIPEKDFRSNTDSGILFDYGRLLGSSFTYRQGGTYSDRLSELGVARLRFSMR